MNIEKKEALRSPTRPEELSDEKKRSKTKSHVVVCRERVAYK